MKLNRFMRREAWLRLYQAVLSGQANNELPNDVIASFAAKLADNALLEYESRFYEKLEGDERILAFETAMERYDRQNPVCDECESPADEGHEPGCSLREPTEDEMKASSASPMVDLESRVLMRDPTWFERFEDLDGAARFYGLIPS